MIAPRPYDPDERTISAACVEGVLLELIEHRLPEGEGTMYQIRVSDGSGPFFFHRRDLVRLRWAEATGGVFLTNADFEATEEAAM